MPLSCMASAVSLISCSLTLQPNAFQSLKPIGGVNACPSSSAHAGPAAAIIATAHTSAASPLRPSILLPPAAFRFRKPTPSLAKAPGSHENTAGTSRPRARCEGVIRRSLVILAAAAALLALPASARAKLEPCCAKLPALHASGLLVLQGVQSGGPSAGTCRGVKLVAHRRTVVRLAAKADGSAPLVGAALYGSRGGRPLPGSPLSAAEGLQDPGKGYTFALPDDWTGGTISLRGQLVPAGAILG